MNRELRFGRYSGGQIESILPALAELRICVFRDYPYLYEGSAEYESAYLHTYVRSARALLFAVFDGQVLVGATTCIPLEDETPEVQKPFLAAGIPLQDVFYFGESVLLREYRGLGLGNRFFEERESHAAAFGSYKMTCFCAVNRPVDHPLKPVDYQPLDAFWQKRGYVQDARLQSIFEWPDIGEAEQTGKPMIYWIKKITHL